MLITSPSAEYTLETGVVLGTSLWPGAVVALRGALGSGKTVMVRGMLRGLGYRGPVQSPTFTLIRAYPEHCFCHVDAFRLSGGEELHGIGIEEYLEDEWICAVEWAERVKPAIPTDALWVTLEYGSRADGRHISFSGGPRYEILLERLREGLDAK